MLGNFAFFSRLHFFSKTFFFPKKSLRNTIRVLNSLDPDFIRLDLGPNCLQRLSADNTRRQKVNEE